MPNTSSAKKKLRADKRKAVINKRIKEKIKNALKKFTSSPSNESLNDVYSSLDKAVKKRVITKQKTARKKSQLAKSIKALKQKERKKQAVSKKPRAKTA